MKDLLSAAKDDKDETNRILAFRGYIAMIGLSTERPPVKVKALREAMDMASRPEEKRLALSGLGDVAHADALKAVEPFLNDEKLKREAWVAYEKIAETMGVKNPTAKTALQLVVDKSTDNGLKGKAKKALDKK